MKRVELNMKEKNIYQIIKKLVDTKGNKKKAAIRLFNKQKSVTL